MDGSRFDAWTRRTFGLVAGGLAVGLVGGVLPHKTDARKKRKRKKRCRKVTETCQPGAKRKCCGRLVCGDLLTFGFRCCKPLGQPCAGEEECCIDGDCIGGTCVLD